jgi:hypothetical protein
LTAHIWQHRGFASKQMLTAMVMDVRYALRGLRRTPEVAAIAVLTLALGIGATTATFSAVYAVVLRPFPFHEPDRGLTTHGAGWSAR